MRVVLQAGHAGRSTGNTGTRAPSGFTEQQFTRAVCAAAAPMLRAAGHEAVVIQADEPGDRYAGDAFVSVHADGNGDPGVHGASVGYRTEEGKQLAQAWKAAYVEQGWSGGFRPDNYTKNLSGYYGTGRAVSAGNPRACIIEAGFLTNPAEAHQLASHAGQVRVAAAIVRAVTGAPAVAPPNPAPFTLTVGWRVLGPGARGALVKLVQAVVSHPFGQAATVGPIDGIYGKATAAGVTNVQRFFGLPPTGTVGADTAGVLLCDWEALRA